MFGKLSNKILDVAETTTGEWDFLDGIDWTDKEALRDLVREEAGNFAIFHDIWWAIQDFYKLHFGYFDIFMMILTPIIIAAVFRLTYGFIIKKIYHYDMITNPATALTLAGYGGVLIYALVTSAPYSTGLTIAFVAAGLPGMVYYAIYTFKMTRNIIITIINTALMYVLIPLMGAALLLTLAFAGITGAAGGSQLYKCENCGRRYKRDISCRCGGVTHLYTE
jgi:hypothetical protein